MEFDLERFVAAQQNGVYESALSQVRRGRKTSHWMWFIFPQIEGLGQSDVSRRFSISGPEEARAYLEHPVLGARLREISAALLGIEGLTAAAIFGDTDAMKLRSSMTLFESVAEEGSVFHEVLGDFFGGKLCDLTLRILGRG